MQKIKNSLRYDDHMSGKLCIVLTNAMLVVWSLLNYWFSKCV